MTEIAPLIKLSLLRSCPEVRFSEDNEDPNYPHCPEHCSSCIQCSIEAQRDADHAYYMAEIEANDSKWLKMWNDAEEEIARLEARVKGLEAVEALLKDAQDGWGMALLRITEREGRGGTGRTTGGSPSVTTSVRVHGNAK